MKYQDDEKKVEVSVEGYESKDFYTEGRAFRDLYATDEKINKPAIYVGVFSLIVFGILSIIVFNVQFDVYRQIIMYYFLFVSVSLCLFAFSCCFFTLKPKGRDRFKYLKWFMWLLSLVAITLAFLPYVILNWVAGRLKLQRLFQHLDKYAFAIGTSTVIVVLMISFWNKVLPCWCLYTVYGPYIQLVFIIFSFLLGKPLSYYILKRAFWIDERYNKIIYDKKIIEIIKKDLDTYFYALGSFIILIIKQMGIISDNSIIALGIAIWSLLESVISRRQNRDIIDDNKELLEKLDEAQKNQKEMKQNILDILVDLKNVQDKNRKNEELILIEKKEIHKLKTTLKSNNCNTRKYGNPMCDGYIAFCWRSKAPHKKV